MDVQNCKHKIASAVESAYVCFPIKANSMPQTIQSTKDYVEQWKRNIPVQLMTANFQLLTCV